MHIALILDRWSPERGGAEAAVAELVHAACDRGYRCTVLAMSGTGSETVDVEVPGFCPWPRGWRERSFARAACRRARSSEFDVSLGFRHVEDVDVFFPHGGLHATALMSSDRSRGRGAWTRWMRSVGIKHRYFFAAEREVLRRDPPAHVIALSAKVEKDFRNAYPEATARFHRIGNGVDLERFRPRPIEERRELKRRLGANPDRPLLLFCAHNPWLKGLATAITMMAGEAMGDSVLYWVGRGQDRAFRAMAERMSVAQRFVHLPPRGEMEDVYPAADVLVHPSYHDPCSRVVLEALASGVPAVTTTVNGASEPILSHGGGVVIEDPRDAESLSVGVRSCLEGGEAWRARARGAAETRPMEDHFDRVLDVLRTAAQERAAR